MRVWKTKEIISHIEKDGWYLVRQTGSHRHYRHPLKKGIVTVPVHGNKDLAPNTAKSILKQAGLA
jgi:predicted RNA binding protein YcfA (HicA-like mRNA interferase family)